MSKEICNPEYLAKALLLKKEEKERLLSRMTGKLPRRLAKEKLTVDEALAIQLEIEDEQLAEWREKMRAIQAKEAAKEQKKKAKSEEKAADKAKAVKSKTVQASTPVKPAKATATPAKPVKSAKPAAAKPSKPKAHAAWSAMKAVRPGSSQPRPPARCPARRTNSATP